MPENDLVCTLTAADYQDREAAWLKVGSLSELVRLEGECCAWMAFAMSESPDGIRLSITSNSEDGERAVRGAFASLARPSGPDARLTT